MSAHWDALQREVLQELGHVLYATADPSTPNAAEPAPLWRALARAAGMEGDVSRLRAVLPDLRLPRDATSRRAMWPALRALRRGP
ncbi:MAG TPA: hypothetical protein VNI56_00560 [Xanthomonadaceae bacterium]|nr:hypothetical protein [Xanthomonadaceae bacterium]